MDLEEKRSAKVRFITSSQEWQSCGDPTSLYDILLFVWPSQEYLRHMVGASESVETTRLAEQNLFGRQLLTNQCRAVRLLLQYPCTFPS